MNEELIWGRLYSLNRKAKWLLARTDDHRARRALANRYMDMAFVAYPLFPAITEEALKKTWELGGTEYVPRFGTWKGELLRHLVGWKAARRLNAAFHRQTNRGSSR